MKCSNVGEDCSKTKCCTEGNTRCFEKGPGWAACKTDCYPWAPDLSDADSKYWTCNKLGPLTPSASPWVAQQCSANGEDCRRTKCCQSPGAQCYAQSEDWAACKTECYPWAPDLSDSDSHYWTCNKLGPLTPSASAWVAEQCSANGEDCRKTKCCQSPGAQCYAQSE